MRVSVLVLFFLIGCAEDEEKVSPVLTDWECEQKLESDLYPDSLATETAEAIKTLCKNNKFRLKLATI